MKKFKKLMALLLALSMVMMSGIFAFADGEALPTQTDPASVSETEGNGQTQPAVPTEDAGQTQPAVPTGDAVQTGNQQVEAPATPSTEKEGDTEEQTLGDGVKVETDSDGKNTEPTDTKGTEGNGVNPPQNPSTPTEPANPSDEPEKVTASVYHRLENKVPLNILHDFSQAEFGPYGDSTRPYFSVTVNMKDIQDLVKAGTLCEYTENGYIYYSAQPSPVNTFPDPDKAKAAARSCWNAIYQTLSADDQQKFIEHFGVMDENRTPNFIGYVFKKEVDGWHIDGILDRAPAYMTEFFLNDKLMKTDVTSEAMTTETAKANIAGILGVAPDTISGMSGTYEKEYKIYQYTIEEGAYSPPSEENQLVRYDEEIHESFYHAKICVTTTLTGYKPVYKVEYYLQQPTGEYVLQEDATEFPLYAEVDAEVFAQEKTFEGYTFNADKSSSKGKVFAPIAGADVESPEYLVLKMYYDIKPSEPPVVPVVPDPEIPVIPPVIPDPVDPQPQPQPTPPDDPLIEEPDEPVEPQPLPPDDPLIEEPDEPTVNPQPLPEDEYLTDSANMERTEDPDQPKTGDEAPLMALTGLFLVSAGALGAIYIKRKKED